MPGGFRIGRIFGIPIDLHPTWFVVFLLVTFGLAGNLNVEHPEWSATLRVVGAAATSLLFFASILLHELGHSVVALRHRVPVLSITLFIFGGVAMLEREPDSARAELQIAIAGPIVSALLALLFGGLAAIAPDDSLPASTLGWLSLINAGVAVFNLLPGFPLDGGRILRAFLWWRSGDLDRATRFAANVGQWIAYAFIAWGALRAVGGDVGGLWTAFIGWFLLSAARATVRQATVDTSLRGLRARDLMSPDVARIPASASVGRFARDLVMRGRRWALVERDGTPVGLISLTDVRRLTPEEWDGTVVGQVATPMAKVLTATLDSPARELLRAMATRQVNQIPIEENGKILGAVTREALVQAIEMPAASRDAGPAGAPQATAAITRS